MKTMQLIDTHSHLYAEEFDDDRPEAVMRARECGVERLLLPAIDSESHERMFALAKAYPDLCRPMMGLHPTSVNDNPRWRDELALVEQYFTQPPEGLQFCAVGEIGLDYYWSQEFVAEQREAFIAQCRLAARLNLPVAIHTRSAWDDMCEILERETALAAERGESLRGVLHAFSEGADVYRRLRECGDWLFGIGGVVTFKKSIVAQAVAEMELEDIILETDCPYLTPVPYRGRRNESAYVAYVCEKVAEIKGVSAEEVARITTANARRMFLPNE
jgi:TatD DNase family protein